MIRCFLPCPLSGSTTPRLASPSWAKPYALRGGQGRPAQPIGARLCGNEPEISPKRRYVAYTDERLATPTLAMRHQLGHDLPASDGPTGGLPGNSHFSTRLNTLPRRGLAVIPAAWAIDHCQLKGHDRLIMLRKMAIERRTSRSPSRPTSFSRKCALSS